MSGVADPTDEDSVAALLAVLALISQNGKQAEEQAGEAAAPGRDASAASPLGRWRTQRMAALAATGSDAAQPR